MQKTFIVAIVCLALSACNCGNLDVGPSGDGGATMGGGAGGADGGADGGATGGGDGGSGGGSGACIPGLASVAITPTDQRLTISAAPTAISFTAVATPGGQNITSQLTWTARRDDDTPPGSFSAPGVYQPQPGTGGTITLYATDGCKTFSTTAVLKLESAFKDPGTVVTSRFNGAVVTATSAKTPIIVYPSDHTRFPRNIYKILFQWKKGGNDYFRLTFEGPGSKTLVYSDGVNLQCQASAGTSGCLETDLQVWAAIASSNAGSSATLTIDGVTMGDANVYRSAVIELGFSKRDVKGAIFYWSTTSAGVRRASVSDLEPEDYLVGKPVATVLPNGGGAVKCVACHTVSRSGKKLAGFTQATTTGEYVYDVTLLPPPTPVITTALSTAKGFATFRMDDQRVVATVGTTLAEFDANTGAKITTLPGIAAGTNPDWSPTTTELVFSDRGGDSPSLANLKSITYSGDTWGAVRTLVPAAGLTNIFPSFSPDGAYVVYARGNGGHGDKTLQLWLARSDGSVPPVELVTANRIVNSLATAGQHENNMPTWAPPGDLLWIAFNSVRPYGVVFPAGGTQQIWVTAIDPAKLGQRLPDGGIADPSFPAFRFAFQGLTENNHRAFWTLDVRDPPDAGPSCKAPGSVCGTGAACCAGLVCSTSGTLDTCQAPNDAGMCLTFGAACNQTAGAACCGFLVCDQVTDGGFSCNAIIN